jgi:hypothetical protein
MLWNGFLLAGGTSHELACCRWLAVADSPTVLGCGDFGATCDQAAGSGGAAAENWDRKAEPAIKLTNTLNAATTAMAGSHRRVRPAPRVLTVARLYRTKLVIGRRQL